MVRREFTEALKNKHLGVGESPGVDDDEREDGTSGPVLCTVRVVVKAFRMSSDFLTPDQVGEVVVKEITSYNEPRECSKS